MTQDPRLDAFRTHEYLTEQHAFSKAATAYANITFQKNPNKPKQFDSIIANKRLDANLGVMDIEDAVRALQKKAFTVINREINHEDAEAYIIENVSMLDPFNRRIAELIEETNRLDFEFRQSFQGFSILEFVKAILNKNEDESIVQIRELAILYWVDSTKVDAKTIEKLVNRFINSQEFISIFKLSIELMALERLNRFVIENTLRTIDKDDPRIVEYIDLVFDFFTDPNNSHFVLPETISFVLELFENHIRSSNYKYDPNTPNSEAYRTYAILKGNESNLKLFEERYGDLNLGLSAKLQDIEALIRNTPEYAKKKSAENRAESINNLVGNTRTALESLGVDVNRVFSKYILGTNLSQFKNQNIKRFSDIDDIDDLITAVLYLLIFFEGLSNKVFHAFDRHRSSITLREIENLFRIDATRTAHGVFLDDKKMAIAFILAAPRLIKLLNAEIDYSKEYNDEVTIELKEDVGDIYKFKANQVVKTGTTKRIRLAINHKPGKTSRQTLISIYPLE